MLTIIDLCHAAANGDLNTVKQAIEQDGIDPNTLHPTNKTRAIDFAAQHGHLAIVQYLVSQQASLDATTTGAQASFLYWICRCISNDQRIALIDWLRQGERYLQLGDGIHEAHLAAAAGETFDLTVIQLHDGLLPWYYGMEVNNRHITEDTLLTQLNLTIQTGPKKGISLAWLLAFRKQWDLLAALTEKSSSPIDLNAASQGDKHPGKGISLAWLLAYDQQWDLLTSLTAKSPTPIDLNAAPHADNHFRKGITLAWWLAACGQLDLLQSLVAKHPTSIDLNAAPHADNHLNKGTSLAWLLAFHKQWDLLATLAEKSSSPIDLNAAPQQDKLLNIGISLAWRLAYHKQWNLFTSLAQNSLTFIDLNAAPQADNHPKKGTTLLTILIEQNQFNLLEKCLEKYFEQEDGHEKLNQLIAKHPTLTKFHELIAYLNIEHRKRSFAQTLKLKNTSIEILQEELTALWEAFEAIDKNLPRYAEIQEMKGNVLLTLANHPDIAMWAANNLIKQEIERYTRFNPDSPLEEKLKVCAIAAFGYAGRGDLCANLYAELIANTTSINPPAHTSDPLADSNETNHDAIQPPPSKRQKTEEIPDNNHTFFAPPLFSSSTASNSSSSQPTSSKFPGYNR